MMIRLSFILDDVMLFIHSLIHSFYFTEHKSHKNDMKNKRTKCSTGQKGQWH